MALRQPQRKIKTQLGDLVVAAYEQAEKVIEDREEASRLAVLTVVRYLLRTGNLRAARAIAEGAAV